MRPHHVVVHPPPVHEGRCARLLVEGPHDLGPRLLANERVLRIKGIGSTEVCTNRSWTRDHTAIPCDDLLTFRYELLKEVDANYGLSRPAAHRRKARLSTAQELSEHGNGKLLGIHEMWKRARRNASVGTRRLSSRDKKGVRRTQQGRERRADMLGRCGDSLRRKSCGQVRDKDPNLHEL